MEHSNASTRTHVASSPIPVADPQTHQNFDLHSQACKPTFTLPPTPQSRKQQRKAKYCSLEPPLPLPPTSDTKNSPKHPLKKLRGPTLHFSSALTSISPSMTPTPVYPLLICSIGNPGPTYANTLHSAGHILTSFISHRKSYTPFQKGLSGLVSRPDSSQISLGLLQGFKKSEGPPPEDDWTIWQSASLMNISGAGVKRAYTEWLRDLRARSSTGAAEGRLVVVHDELESALGKVVIRDGSASAKGHNGLKSCQQQLSGVRWWRIGVGIGRPESREPSVVSRYVLGKIRGNEKVALERSAVGVVDALREIAEGKR